MNWTKGTTRAEALTDGAFAIIMTLLVIEMHPPTVDDVTTLFNELWIYVISFVFLGTYWIAHYNLFHWIKNVNHPLLWMNIWFVSMASLVPLSTSFLVANPGSAVAMKWYAGHVLLILLPLVCMTLYAKARGLLVDESKGQVVKVMRVMAVPTVIVLWALVLS